jgi:hypothetical protein
VSDSWELTNNERLRNLGMRLLMVQYSINVFVSGSVARDWLAELDKFFESWTR